MKDDVSLSDLPGTDFLLTTLQLKLYGNELNYFSTTFNCGIITGAGMEFHPMWM